VVVGLLELARLLCHHPQPHRGGRMLVDGIQRIY
jgi:hypothetical protein